jgi:hypothetical protein
VIPEVEVLHVIPRFFFTNVSIVCSNDELRSSERCVYVMASAKRCCYRLTLCSRRINEPVKMSDFWDVVPCSLIESKRRFRDAYCLHRKGVAAMQHPRSHPLSYSSPWKSWNPTKWNRNASESKKFTLTTYVMCILLARLFGRSENI